MLNQTIADTTRGTPDNPGLRARFETTLLIDGQAADRARVLPLVGAMLPAFAAFGRGTEFATPGPAIAVEDLWPGDQVLGLDSETATVTALAQVTLNAALLDAVDYLLLRVLPDRFGPGRPSRDLILGPSAQVIATGRTDQSLVAEDLLDHDMVLGLNPPGAVTLFQVVCDRPVILRANGVQVPSFDPAIYANAQGVLVREWLAYFFDGGRMHEVPLGLQAGILRHALG